MDPNPRRIGASTQSKHGPRAVTARRRLLAGVAALLLVARTRRAQATPVEAKTVPRSLLELDLAALALFDAAAAGRWIDAQNTLPRARAAARAVSREQASYAAAGGDLDNFVASTGELTADLVEVSAATAERDRKWLVSAAANVLERAGELTEPYASRIGAAAPRLEVLLVLARRMQKTWPSDDKDEFAAAHRAFDRLWPALRDQLNARRPYLVERVDAARAGLSVAPSSANAGTLYVAVRDLLGRLAVG